MHVMKKLFMGLKNLHQNKLGLVLCFLPTYLFICQQTFALFHVLAIMNDSAINMKVQIKKKKLN